VEREILLICKMYYVVFCLWDAQVYLFILSYCNSLSPFLTMLAPFCDNPRITALSQVTPVYLKKFFTAVIPLSTSEIASSLITGMLERVLVILGPSDSIPGIRRLFCCYVLLLY
jgi:type III secretory pathway component EscU